MFNSDGKLNDVQDIKIGMVDASAFAFVADGKNGLRVLQILSPEDSPNSYGFSPRPTPKLIASYRTAGPALAISKGIDRDLAVDGTTAAIRLPSSGRVARSPAIQREKLSPPYLRDGKPYTVSDDPPAPARAVTGGAKAASHTSAPGKPELSENTAGKLRMRRRRAVPGSRLVLRRVSRRVLRARNGAGLTVGGR